MIIIDAHVSVSGRDQQIGHVLGQLHAVDTDSAIVFADATAADLESSNRYILRSGQEFDCYPFYYMGGNPFTDTRMDLDVPPNLEDYSGLRWHGWFAESEDRGGRVDRHELDFAVMTMESPEFTGLMAALAYYDKPVLFEEDYAVTVEFVRRYPELKIIIPHLGVLSGGQENVVGQFYRNPNVYFTTSHGVLDPVTMSRLGPERLLYASHFPYGKAKEEIAKIKQLELSDEEEALVFGENVERILSREVDEDDVL
jgi:hypothetical protein